MAIRTTMIGRDLSVPPGEIRAHWQIQQTGVNDFKGPTKKPNDTLWPSSRHKGDSVWTAKRINFLSTARIGLSFCSEAWTSYNGSDETGILCIRAWHIVYPSEVDKSFLAAGQKRKTATENPPGGEGKEPTCTSIMVK